MRRLALLAPAVALTVALLLALAAPGLSKVVEGTDDPETLIGTKRNDQITGKGGQDLLKGKDGNDKYIFADDWGQDRGVVEKRRQGNDTLDFSAVSSGAVLVIIVRAFDKFEVSGPNNALILVDPEAGIPYIETVIGGTADGDALVTGGGPNTLMPGGGATDILEDRGGYDEGPGSGFTIPPSNDTYRGFSSNSGTDTIRDYGGSDVVDLRPASSSSVTMTAIDGDGSNGTKESLQIAWNFDPNVKVVINGHFGPYDPLSSQTGLDGHIEKLIFADKTFTDKNPPPVEGL